MKFLLRFEWVVRGVTGCAAKNSPLKKKTEITRNGSNCLKTFIGFLELMSI
jgi:hypothetical protein